VLCDYSSSDFHNVNVTEPSELCLNSELLQCELLKIQDELKSAWLIIELLVNEVTTLKACSGTSVSDCMTEDTNTTGSHEWIPAKRKHLNSQKRDFMKQPKNFISLTNSFETALL